MPAEITKEYDVCFVAFNKIENDARTINMALTLSNFGKKVCIVGLVEHNISQNENKFLAGVDLYQINHSPNPRMWNRWLTFSNETKKLKPIIKSEVFIAEDLYSLHIVRRWTKKTGSKFIYDSREIYSALGPLYKNKFKQFLLSIYEKYFIRYVDEMIVSGQMDGEYLKKYFKHNVPYNLVLNLPYYKEPVKSNLIRDKYQISDNHIAVIYQGMILPGRGINKIISALQHIENAHFFILGEGGYRFQYEKLSEDIGVMNRVHFCGLIPYNELHQWTCSADIGLVFIEPISFSYELALPNKLFEYCMAGLPSLVSDLPAMRDILTHDNIGLLINVDLSPAQIAEKIRFLYANKEKYKTKCRIASMKYAYESQQETILGMLDWK